ncbi:hypothetical protein ACOBV8_19560 (plasmid) [Pseudoalteromonas espejiana]
MGTLDGANIEIRDAVGAGYNFLFAHKHTKLTILNRVTTQQI